MKVSFKCESGKKWDVISEDLVVIHMEWWLKPLKDYQEKKH